MYQCVRPQAQELYDTNPQKHIEICGRTCYKSEDKITEDSNKAFVTNMHKNGHWAMLEHFRFIAIVPPHIHTFIKGICSPYIATTVDEFTNIHGDKDLRYMVSTNARALMDAVAEVDQWRDNGLDGPKYDTTVALLALIKHIIYHYGCTELFGGEYSACQQYNIDIIENHCLKEDKFTMREIMAHGWHTVKFTVDRGVTHEFVRHRPPSFAQESTRYCNYSNGKFGEAIAVIRPFEFREDTELLNLWEKCMHYANEMYKQMIKAGASPQWARSILPQSTKADLIITTTNSEWKHIIDLRYTGVTGKPHPQMVEAMTELVESASWAGQLSRMVTM